MDRPRLIYHGTDAETARLILEQGILPRSRTGKSQWNTPSHPEHVYLTRYYAGYFGYQASDGGPIGIIEVDLDQLDPACLYPDEDFVEQTLRAMGTLDPEIAGDEFLRARTLAIRHEIEQYQTLWEASLDGLGNVAHRGPIPPSAITRISLYDPDSNPYVTLQMLDPTITLLNAQLAGPIYEEITAWLMGDPVTPERMLHTWNLFSAQEQAEVRQWLDKRNGLCRIK